MIFFIGGSHLAIAAVQSDSQSTVQSMPCHEQHMMQHHHTQPIQTDVMQMGHCHDGKQIHPQCQDCKGLSHCQIVNLFFEQSQPILFVPLFDLNVIQNSDDQSQHLVGYWQQILRPPKT